MLFVNEEFEESHPVFSKPKKVHPETEDEMVRRIKYTLGEYVHENDANLVNSEKMSKQEETVPLPSNSNLQVDIHLLNNDEEKEMNENSKDQNSFEMSESIKDIDVSSVTTQSNVKFNESENCENSSLEMSTSNSRRCSLKRQCKERISLLDYNPMLTIRAKRTRTSTSHRTKSVDSIEELNVTHQNLTAVENSKSISKQALLSEHSRDTFEHENDGIPNLKAFPVVQLTNSISEVPIKDSPPLLHISSPSCHIATLSPVISVQEPNDMDSKKDIIPQVKIKSKKQSKKKKRKAVYKSLSIEGEISKESSGCVKNNEDYKESTTDTKVGSCQIKNGILKIRLSKLTDSKKDGLENDYEVSHCEAAAFGCKRLSVPLEPLAPSVYSAYCVSYKSKKKDNSSNKSKRSGKKKEKKNKLEKARLDIDVNKIVRIDSDIPEKVIPSQEAIDSKTISHDKIISKPVVENNELEQETRPKAEEIVQTFQNNNIFVPENQSVVNIGEKVKSPIYKDEIVKSPIYKDEKVKSPTYKDSTLPSFNNLSEDSDKIVCTIDLSKISRIPMKNLISNLPSDKVSSEFSLAAAVEKQGLNTAYNISKNDSNAHSFEINKNSTEIKKEVLTPPSFDLIRINQTSLEGKDSPYLSALEEQRDDSCPKLTPAYPFEVSHTEDLGNKSEFGNNSPQMSKLCSADTEFISDFQEKNTAKLINSYPHQSVNRVKIEFSDSALSNEKWNEYKEYKWSHDHTDAYSNGVTLFKEQVGTHGFWQDPELKKQYSSEYYLNEAKKLKHQADKEIDRMVQAMKYLEAVLYFILTGNAMEHSYIDTDRVHTMYKETLTLIRFISSKFQKLHNSSCRNIDNKLTVLSLRCQSLLYLKMYQLRRDEVRCLHRSISSFLKTETGLINEHMSPPHLQSIKQSLKQSQVSPSHQASPCSLTPSPAGSVASVSSQSSGYSSSELGWNSNFASSGTKTKSQLDLFSDNMTVSRNKYKMLQLQSMYLANLHLSHDLWEHADYLSSKEHSREFFMELDEECGCLSLHSPFSALVHYVRKGLYKLKDGT